MTTKKGPMIKVNNDVSRNVSCFQKINSEVSKELFKRSDMDEDNEIFIPNSPKKSIHSSTPDAKVSSLPEPFSPLQIPKPISGRGQRRMKLPGRYRYFTMK